MVWIFFFLFFSFFFFFFFFFIFIFFHFFHFFPSDSSLRSFFFFLFHAEVNCRGSVDATTDDDRLQPQETYVDQVEAVLVEQPDEVDMQLGNVSASSLGSDEQGDDTIVGTIDAAGASSSSLSSLA